uniref:MRG domain-containing protein n=1 Tax=Caenorhabditis japonica TaxID=281687 RepID=A0A8R1DNH4_CAEJA
MPKVHLAFAVGDNLTCVSKGLGYDAKIQEIKKQDSADPLYVVHFMNWNHRYDETIPASQAKERLHSGTAEEYEALTGIPVAPANKAKKAAKTTKKEVVAKPAEKTKTPKRAERTSVTPALSSSSSMDQDLKVTLPRPLILLLSDDFYMSERDVLPTCPARFTIDRIVADYIKSIPITNQNLRIMDDLLIEYEENDVKITNVALICTARALCDYFNVVHGYQLLYQSERAQYAALIAKESRVKNVEIATLPEHGFRASEHYGIVHLLRMIARLPQLFQLTKWNDHLISRIMVGVHDFLVFLNKNHTDYLSGADDYEPKAKAVELFKTAPSRKTGRKSSSN